MEQRGRSRQYQSINQSINQEFYSDLSMAEAKGHQVLAEGARTGGGGVSLPQCESGVATLGKIMYILTQNVAFLCTFSQKLAPAAVKNVPSKHNWCLEA